MIHKTTKSRSNRKQKISSKKASRKFERKQAGQFVAQFVGEAKQFVGSRRVQENDNIYLLQPARIQSKSKSRG